MHLRFRTLVSFLHAKRYMKWRVLALVLIVLVLASRLTIWLVLEQTNNDAVKQNFDMATAQRVNDIQNQLEIYANTLYASRALFLAGGNVSRQNWNAFVDGLQVDKRYPAFYALGYMSVIDQSGVGALTAQLNANRLPSETAPVVIHPFAASNQLVVLTYVAPSTVSQANIGYNALADPDRAKALAESRDSGLPHASKPLTVLTDPINNAPPTIFIVLPTYIASADGLQTVAQRQAALQGYVALALRIKPLLDGVFAESADQNLNVSIMSDGQAIYQYGPELSGTTIDKQQDVTVAGQTWTINFKAPPDFGLSSVAKMTQIILSLSALPFLLLVSLILYFATRVYQPK